MLFSILISVYNTEKYLEECLDSIAAQTFADYEVILVDDGSSDKSGEICDSFYKQHPDNTVVIHQTNQGLLMARREAFKHAKGLYYICCDADDILSKDALEILSAIIKQEQPDLIQYDLFLFNEKGEVKNINPEPFLQDRIMYDNIDILRNCLVDRTYNIWSMAGKCILNRCIDNSADYSELKCVQYGEDTLQSIEVYNRARNFFFITDKIYYYRAYSGMMKCLPHKYCQDFFLISDVLKKHIQQWGTMNPLMIHYFILKISYDYFLHISDQHFPYKTIKERIMLLATDNHFSSSFKKYIVVSNESMELTGKMRFLLRLIYRQRSLILYFLIKLRAMKKSVVDSAKVFVKS